MSIYVGINGVARKDKVIYDGVGGVARKVSEVYDGVGGVARLVYSGLPPIGLPLANYTWEEINKVSQSGKAQEYWSVGAEKNITLSTGEVLTLQIYDFNHDDLTGGGKAGITFGLKNLMGYGLNMNNSSTNSGGFTGSIMYSWLIGSLYNFLPADLKELIKTVNKNTSAGNKNPTINTNAMKVFLFSEIECFGTLTDSFPGEGFKYAIFINNASRIKKMANGTGAAQYWWERSPVASQSTAFCTPNLTGRATFSTADNPWGVCFGFCI